MAKSKISFDIDKNDFEKIKLLVKSSNLTQGDFLRKAIKNALKEFDEKIITVYTVENGSLNRKVINRSEYDIEVDESEIDKELLEDFAFVKSGYLFRNGVRVKFYSKVHM